MHSQSLNSLIFSIGAIVFFSNFFSNKYVKYLILIFQPWKVCTLREAASFELSRVKIPYGVWPVGALKKKRYT